MKSVILAASFLLTGGQVVLASTRHVPAQYPTIQAGLDAAVPGDVVLVAPGTYLEYETRYFDGFPFTSCAFLKDGVALRSEAGAAVTTIDLQSLAGFQTAGIYALYLANGPTSVEGFTIKGGGLQNFGTIAVSCQNLMFQDCIYRDLITSEYYGAAIVVSGDISIGDCEFVNCHAEDAAAIWHTDGHLNLTGSIIRDSGDRAVHSEGIEGAPPVSVYISDCQFLDNIGERSGAALVAVYVHGGAIVRDCLFRGNLSYGNGGGAVALGLGPVTVENCVFIENGTLAGAGQGGGLNVGSGPFPCIVSGNTFFKNYKTPNSSPGASVYFQTYGVFERNIVVGSQGGAAISSAGGNGGVETSCNVYWVNPEGVGIPLSPTDRETDPLFCDPVTYDLTLRSGSPCLPEDPLGCGLIGAFGQGCGTISVEEKTWGAIKGLYR